VGLGTGLSGQVSQTARLLIMTKRSAPASAAARRTFAICWANASHAEKPLRDGRRSGAGRLQLLIQSRHPAVQQFQEEVLLAGEVVVEGPLARPSLLVMAGISKVRCD